MSSTITKQVVSELENMQKNLQQFKGNIEYLNEAKAHIADSRKELEEVIKLAIKSLQGGEKAFQNHSEQLYGALNNINALKDASDAIIYKIQGIDFPARLQKIETGIEQSNQQIQLHKENVVKEIGKLIKEVEQANFEGNFKSFTTIIANSAKSNAAILETGIRKLEDSGTKTSIQSLKIIQDLNIPSRMDKLDANIIGIQTAILNLMSKSDHLERDIREQFSKISSQLNQQDKSIKGNQLMILIFLTVITIGTAAGFFLLSRMK